MRREQNLKTLTPNPSSQRDRGAYFLIFKTYFLSIRKYVFKLILGKGFKNSKFYFETVSLNGRGEKETKYQRKMLYSVNSLTVNCKINLCLFDVKKY